MRKTLQIILKIITVIFALFSMTISLFPYDALSARSLHLAFILVIVFLYKGVLAKENPSKIRIAFHVTASVLCALACLYIFKEAFSLQQDRLGLYTDADLISASILIVGVLIATWETFGTSITALVGAFLAYVFLGQYLPYAIGHPGVSVYRIVSNLGLYTEGIFGPPLGSSATIISAFIIFAAFLEVSGGASLFMDISVALFGRVTGGASKVAVVASSLFGMISGSAAANVAGTGMITIPLMKKSGFEPHIAGAVEAAASSGGQIMPPIMGAAAFIIADMLRVSYGAVMSAAILPAIIYYVAIFMGVDLYSRKNKIKGTNDEIPKIGLLLRQKGLLMLPIVILLIFIGFCKRSPQMSALYATISVLFFACLKKNTRFTVKNFFDALEKGSYGIIDISVICAASGIILGIFTVTGVGLKLSSAIVAVASGKLPLLLVLAMVASLILGMGVPTVAAYLILAILVAPAMVDFGVLPMAAHMFVFYFGIISAITPPVAVAAYVGAGIAGAKPFKVGLNACILAFPAFIVPYSFVYNPALLLIGEPREILQITLTSLFGAFMCAVATQGYFLVNLKHHERVIAFIAAICALIPESFSDIAGIVLAAILIAILFQRMKREKIT
jgi:TRAP transporter 4TM/12TM fusion protein